MASITLFARCHTAFTGDGETLQRCVFHLLHLCCTSDAAFTGNDETCEPDVFHFFVVLAPEGVIYALDGEMHNKRFHIFSCMENAMQL